jgi:hypothetical protein
MDDATNIYYSHVADMNIPDTTTETLCLSGQDIQEKFVSPFSLIASTSAVTVNRNGNPIILGVDYVVEKNVLQWSGTSLDGTMTAGDVLQVTYMPEDVSPTAKIIVKVDTPDSSHPGEYTPVETLLSVQAITVDTTNIIMARTLSSDTTADPWNIQFYVDNSEDTVDYGRGYISNFVATADSITGTDRVKQNALKTWRKPLLVYNDRRPFNEQGNALNPFQLSTIAGAGGIITVPSTSPVNFNSGPIVADMSSGYNFLNWTVTNSHDTFIPAIIADVSSATTTLVLTGDATILASFYSNWGP